MTIATVEVLADDEDVEEQVLDELEAAIKAIAEKYGDRLYIEVKAFE